jgi:DNA-binding FadR family transcriptional regulator
MRLHRETMLEFLDAIVSGELEPGTRLPKETALVERYDISRGVARESMRALEERGLVTVKHGGRTVVNPREAWDLLDADVITVALGGAAAVSLLADYLELRRMIEVDGAGFAAARASGEQVERLEQCLKAMKAALGQTKARIQEREYLAADVAFHLALVEATGNQALVTFVRRIDAALLAARYPLARPRYRRTRAIPEHEAILDAVRARDEVGAREAMRTHLDTVEQYLREHARRVARAA